MTETLQWFGALCASDGALRGGLLLGLLVAGATGSIIHCGPMCGVFVLGQTADRMGRLSPQKLCEWRRVSNGLLLPYHLGRLTTYAGLGAIAAASTGILGNAPWVRGMSALLLMFAALLFVTHAIGRNLLSDRIPRFLKVPIGRVTQHLDRNSWPGEYLLGLALGFLPCGLLYAALAAAAASGRPALGAAAMLAFGLGTAPVLMMIGIAGNAAGRQWTQGVARVAPVVMVLNAGLLSILAWQRLPL